MVGAKIALMLADLRSDGREEFLRERRIMRVSRKRWECWRHDSGRITGEGPELVGGSAQLGAPGRDAPPLVTGSPFRSAEVARQSMPALAHGRDAHATSCYCSPLWSAGVAPVDVGHGLGHFAEGAVVEGRVYEGGHDVGGMERGNLRFQI